MNTSPHYILFDLGGTLMCARGDWTPVLARADQALADTLLASGIQLETQTFRARLRQYYAQRDQDCHETTYHFVLRELLRELGYPEVEETLLRSALAALYNITQKNWGLEDDATAMLAELRANQYRLGILSNAGDDKDVQELVNGFGVRAHFDFVLTSAACYYRKPHPRAFEIALAQWNIPPEEAVMVGDSLSADIEGAKKLGMQTVWITRRAGFSPAEKTRVQPDFEIPTLAGLLPVLEKIQQFQIWSKKTTYSKP